MRLHSSILLLFFFVACSNKPQGLLPKEKMIAVIYDLQLADAAYKANLLPTEQQNNKSAYFVEVCKANEIDTAAFNKTMMYYMNEPKELKKIYEEVEKKINEIK